MQNYNLASDQAHFTTNVCAGILGEKIMHHYILRNCGNQIKFAQAEQNILLCKKSPFFLLDRVQTIKTHYTST